MTNPDYPNQWLSLNKIREKLPRGNWRHGNLWEYATVATDNGILLSDFLDLDEEDMANLIAYRRAKSTIEAYEQFLSEKKNKQRK